MVLLQHPFFFGHVQRLESKRKGEEDGEGEIRRKREKINLLRGVMSNACIVVRKKTRCGSTRGVNCFCSLLLQTFILAWNGRSTRRKKKEE